MLAYYQCPRLCTLVLNGLVQGMLDMPFDGGQGIRGRYRQLRSARDAGSGRQQEGKLSAALWAAGRGEGWHFLTGEEDADPPPDRGRRLSLPLRSGAETSSFMPAAS